MIFFMRNRNVLLKPEPYSIQMTILAYYRTIALTVRYDHSHQYNLLFGYVLNLFESLDSLTTMIPFECPEPYGFFPADPSKNYILFYFFFAKKL